MAEDQFASTCIGPLINRPAACQARDLDMNCRLADESLALAYLLLLDEYGVGEMVSESSG